MPGSLQGNFVSVEFGRLPRRSDGVGDYNGLRYSGESTLAPRRFDSSDDSSFAELQFRVGLCCDYGHHDGRLLVVYDKDDVVEVADIRCDFVASILTSSISQNEIPKASQRCRQSCCDDVGRLSHQLRSCQGESPSFSVSLFAAEAIIFV